MSSIYRDYRPQKFADILGQNHLKITLQNELANNSLAHAYLFCGPRAVGKTSMARVLSQAVNCESRKEGEYEPCGQCPSCIRVREGKALDVMEIDAASNTGVDNVRDNVIASARLAPAYAKMKVFIIDEVHMLSISAFNALLKIIEEPPQHVLFILCTTEVHKVPSTIISRCQRFDFKRISPAEIVKKLSFIARSEDIIVDQDVLENVARQSGGHLRDAESLFGQILALGEKHITLEKAELVLPRYHRHEALSLIEALAAQKAGEAITIINNLADNGVNFKNFLAEVLMLLRKIMLQSVQPGLAEKLGLDLGEQTELRITQMLKTLSLSHCLRLLKRFILLSKDVNTNLDQLSFEVAAVELAHSADTSEDNKDNFNVRSTKLNNTKPGHNLKEAQATSATDSKVEINSAMAADVKAEEVLSRWPEVLMKIKKHNHSLSFVLQNCIPEAITSGSMVLRFKYKFHRDRILNAAIKPITENTLAEVFAGRVNVEAVLDEEIDLGLEQSVAEEDTANIDKKDENELKSKDSQSKSGVLNSLLTNLGGEAL
jgi:DNA polymerase III subunit gamma/tau